MDENVFNYSHACALCKNLSDLREPCCCPKDSSEMVQVVEPRLLKRCALRKGQHLCLMHYEKLKNGLIFGVSSTGCCAPFHIESSTKSHLRPVPRSWRHLFDNSAVRERYLPSLQICAQCYNITLDLILGGENNDSNSKWEASDTSSISDKYTSPRRWISSVSLHTSPSNASDSSIFSSTSQLSAPPSSNISSLYERYQKQFGQQEFVPESIKRFLRSTTPLSSEGSRKLQNVKRNNSLNLKLRSDKMASPSNTLDRVSFPFKKQSSSASLPLPEISSEENSFVYKSSTPKFALNSPENEEVFSRARHVKKQRLASSEEKKESDSKSEISGLSSSEADVDWQSISLNENEDDQVLDFDVVASDSEQDFEILSASLLSDKTEDDKNNHKLLSISIQSFANPELKLSKKKPEATPVFDDNTKHPCINVSRFDSLDSISDKSISSERTHIDDVTPLPTSEDNLPMSQHDHETTTVLHEKLGNSGLSQDDITDLISLLQPSEDRVLHLYANTLSQCVVDFALEDITRIRTKNTDNNVSEHSVQVKDFAECQSLIKRGIEIVDFAQSQSSEILINALESMRKYSNNNCENHKTFRSEFNFNTRKAQLLRLKNSKQLKNSNCQKNGLKTTVRWNEEKNCFQTVLTVQLKNEIKPRRIDRANERFGGAKNLPIVECIVEDIIPVTRSFSTGFIDEVGHVQADSLHTSESRPNRIRSSSFNSYFTLTCELSESRNKGDSGFTATPIRSLKTDRMDATTFSSHTPKNHSLTESEISTHAQESDSSSDTLERLSISSKESLASSSSMEECKNFEAELLKHRKLTNRPHFVSHKSRIDDSLTDNEPQASVPFELKPEQASTSEEKSESSAFEPITDDDASHYTEAMSTVSASATEDLSAKPALAETKSNSTENTDRVSELKSRKSNTSYDWYTGDDIERRRSTRFLKALSQAAFLSKTTSKRREVRIRKTDEDPEDEDVASVIGKAIEDYSPRIFRRKHKNSNDEEESEPEESSRKKKVLLQVAVVFGVVGALFYVGWKLYS